MKRLLLTAVAFAKPSGHRAPLRPVLLVIMLCGLCLQAGFATGDEPRFRDLGDGTVADRETGLVWLRQADALGTNTWEGAIEACAGLKAGGTEELQGRSRAGTWRLPAAHEILTLTDRGLIGSPISTNHPFSGLKTQRQATFFWTSSEGYYDTGTAFRVEVKGNGGVAISGKREFGRVWPVKGAARRLAQHEGKAPDLVSSFAKLTSQEKERAEINALYDVAGLRLRREFVRLRTSAFLEPPAGFPAYPLGEYRVARRRPELFIQVLPDMAPQYFPEGEAYQAGWANWAAVTRSDDNRLVMAAGDHRGKGSQINIYRFTPGGRPAPGRLERVVDLTAALGWHGGMYTDGKIHGHMGIMPDGTAWGATHHGPYPTDAWREAGYRGSWFFNFNIDTGACENMGVPLEGQSLPNSRLDTQRGIFFANGELTTSVFCYDTAARRVLYADAPPNGWKWGSRATFLDEATGCFWGIETSEKPYRFISYDPARNLFKRHDDEVPVYPGAKQQSLHGAWAAGPDSQGRYYTDFGGVFTRCRPDWDKGPQLEVLGVTGRQESFPVLQMAMSPDQRFVYWTPRADDTMAIMQYEIATGRLKIIGFLKAAVREKYGLLVGNGVWGMNITGDGASLVILENGGFGRPFWGHPVLLVVSVPKSER